MIVLLFLDKENSFQGHIHCHPEQGCDEIYMGNTLPQEVFKSSWLTSRLGHCPQKSDGTPLLGDYRPWFIKRSEVQATLDNVKYEKYAQEEKRRIYQGMLDKGTAL